MSRNPGRYRPPARLRAGRLVGAAVVACTALLAVEMTGPAVGVAAAAPTGFTRLLGDIFGPGHYWWWHFPAPPRSTRPTPTAPTAVPTNDPTSSPPTGVTTDPTAVPPVPSPTADPNPNCTLVVPRAALTAAGLATPYRLTATDPTAGACHEADTAQSAFVEAAILDPATGAISLYHPLVIDDGTQPAIAPVTPTLPRGAVVGVWFGYQADLLTLRVHRIRRGGFRLAGARQSSCVNGTPGSPFGQFADCNARQFFAAANRAIQSHQLVVPPLGTGIDGQPCPTTRDFTVVDQDQSDNLPAKYLATPDGRTAQYSAANSATLTGAGLLTNASDNGLVDGRLDPILGCHPFTAPDLSQSGAPSAGLALNELQAAADQAEPVALVPPNDPMTLDGTAASVAKTNLYRAGVDQPPMDPATSTGAAYCTSLADVAPARLTLDEQWTSQAPSPDPAVATSLYGFLVSRLTESWANLGCETLTGRPAPTVGIPTAPAAALDPPAPLEPTTTTAPPPDPAPTPTPLPSMTSTEVANPPSSATGMTGPTVTPTADPASHEEQSRPHPLDVSG